MSEDPTPYGGPESEVTRLRLALSHAEMQRDSFEAALSKAVMVVIKEAATPRTVDGATAELWKLRSDNWQKSLQIAMAEVDEFKEYLKWTGIQADFAEWQEWRRQKSDGGPAKEGGAS